MPAVPQQCIDAGCPQAMVSKGFALGSGSMPPKSGICILLEAPGPDEPVFLVKNLTDGSAEIERRRERYPELESQWITKGAPVVGRAGNLMWYWILQPLGLQRSDVAVFNTLHCYPGKTPTGEFAYPKGAVRKRAEATCAELWLGPLLEWEPTVVVEAMHPSALNRDITPLPVVRRAVEKAKTFASRGERVLLLMGGKAAKHILGYGNNVTRWCVHHQVESEFTRGLRRDRWAANRRLSVVKTVRVKKLTLKQEVLALLNQRVGEGNPDNIGGKNLWTFYMDDETRERILALMVTKKKVKPQEMVIA